MLNLQETRISIYHYLGEEVLLLVVEVVHPLLQRLGVAGREVIDVEHPVVGFGLGIGRVHPTDRFTGFAVCFFTNFMN